LPFFAFAKKPTEEEAELGLEHVVFRPPFVGDRARAGISSFLNLEGLFICEMLLAKSFYMVGKKTGRISLALDLLRGLGPEAPLQKLNNHVQVKNMRSYRLCALQMQAALVGCADVVEWAQQRGERGVFNRVPKIDAGHPSYNGALVWAAEKGHTDRIDFLLTAGADLNAATEDGFTPAFIAAQEGHAPCLQVLAERGADLNAAAKDGFTPAFIAAQNGHAPCLQVLAERGADLNAATNDGFTPAFIAEQNGHAPCLQVLAERGADLNASDKKRSPRPTWPR